LKLGSAASTKVLYLPALALITVLFVAPFLWTVVSSFLTYSATHAATLPLTAANYIEFLHDPSTPTIVLRTLRVSLITTVACLLLGYPVAGYLALCGPRMRSAITVVLLTPLLISVVARTYGWSVILGPSGLVNSLLLSLSVTAAPFRLLYTEGAIDIGLTHVLLPYMVLSIDAALSQFDRRLISAARSLGASPLATFRRVVWPLALPGVLSGSLLVFALAASAFVTPSMLGGGHNRVVPSLIFEQTLVLFDRPLASAIAVSFLAGIVVLLALYLQSSSRSVATASGRS
jgi:putative spermidine/putrescine transport system permease protein